MPYVSVCRSSGPSSRIVVLDFSSAADVVVMPVFLSRLAAIIDLGLCTERPSASTATSVNHRPVPLPAIHTRICSIVQATHIAGPTGAHFHP